MKPSKLKAWLNSEIDILKRELHRNHSNDELNSANLFQCAQNGNVKEVERIIATDRSTIHAKNSQGLQALHVAASKGHLNVVEALIKANADIDAVDNHKETALHMAVKHGRLDVVTFLLKHGADLNAQNDVKSMPAHIAAERGSVDIMKVLLEFNADPNSKGEGEQTILHFAAANNDGEMVKLVLSHGANPNIKCAYGYYPIHVAAKSAADKAMEAIIEHVLELGQSRESILSFRDKENNLPLHSAVNGGNLKAVEVCLRAGASVKVQQEDGSTPLHFACSQGNMDMIRMMKEAQLENYREAIKIQDKNKMTPLHRAALFNHKSVVDFLLDENAAINARDIHERTPLLLAASKGCWGTVQLLVSRGVDISVHDKNNMNFLHLAIKFGGKLKCLTGPTSQVIQELLNERDDFGCTPLHYASKEGHLMAFDDLIKMGALVNLKDNKKQSPFHFAAKYGRVNTCKRLLDSTQGPNLINETDGNGHSALHIAAENGHIKIIQLLLERGAVFSKDNQENYALHHAAANGWTNCMELLLGVHHNIRDATNCEGKTALHVAALNGKKNAVIYLLTTGAKILHDKNNATFFDYIIQQKYTSLAKAVVDHDRWEEVLQDRSLIYGYYILGLIEHLPSVCINVLDRCKVPSSNDPKQSSYHITYNFKFLETDCVRFNKDGTKQEYHPMVSLYAMVKNNRVDCLSHSVCTTFLESKWRRYGMWINAAYLFVYILFLSSITALVVNENSLQHFDNDSFVNSSDFLYGNNIKFHSKPLGLCIWIITLYCFMNCIKEIVQLINHKFQYFADPSNALEWSLYITSLLFVTPFLMNLSYHWQWECGALAVFLAWFNCLVFLQRFDFFGIYVVMFLEILQTLLQVLSVFSILIIAFGLSFYMLMHEEESRAYSTPLLSFLRTFMMMLELDYLDSFNGLYVDDKIETLHFDKLTLVFLVAFVLLMPILLMNLLIGLAVGDIEVVRNDASLKRLAMQVELHINMERKMPKFLRDYAKIETFEIYPNKCLNMLENVFSKISSKTYSESEVDSSPDMSQQALKINMELFKQKSRMQNMKIVLDKNNQLLRKIMEKMEIHAEDDAWDEGGKSGDHERDTKAVSKYLNASSVH